MGSWIRREICFSYEYKYLVCDEYQIIETDPLGCYIVRK